MKVWREPGWWILAALILLLFWEPLTTATFFFRDLYLLFVPKKLQLAAAFRAGEIPLWDVPLHGGQPFLGGPDNSVYAPTNLLYLLLPALTAWNLILVLQFVFCAWAAYWLARVLGLSRAAAFTCGALYALCGYTLSVANLLSLVLSFPFVPLTVAFAHRLLTRGWGRDLAGAALSAAMPLLHGAAELTGMMLVITAVWLVIGCPAAVPMRRRAMTLGAIVFFAVVLTLAQTVPTLEVMSQSARGSKQTYESFSEWSLSPMRLPELVIPRFFGPTGALEESDYWGLPFEGQLPYILSIYIGAPALLLMLAGALSDRPPRARWAMAGVAATGIVFAAGSHLPFFPLVFEYVPLVGIFRYPVKAMMLALVPMAVLAGWGVDALRTRSPRWMLALAAGTSLLLLAAFAMHGSLDRLYFGIDLAARLQTELRQSLLHASGASALFALLLAAGKMRGRDAGFPLAALVAIDLALAGYTVNVYAPRALFADMPLAATVRAAMGGGRFYTAPRPEFAMRAPTNDVVWLALEDRRLLRSYTAASFGIPMLFHDDYNGLAPRRMMRLTRAVNALPWPQRRALLDRSGVTVFLSPDRVAGDALREAEVETGTRSPLYLYRNERAVPFRFASRVVHASSEDDAFRLTVSGALQSDAVVLEQPRHAGVAPCAGGRARLLERSSRALTVAVEAPCEGYLVMNETFYPGWEATVDERPADLLRADYAFSAVPVPRGSHIVRRVYRPWTVPAGLSASAFGVALLLAAALRLRRQRNREAA